jgi:hypothetical protein
MRASRTIGAGAVIALIIVALASSGAGASARAGFGGGSATITNRFLPISDFHRCILRGNDGGQRLRIVRVLMDRTRVIHFHGRAVRAAVVRDTVRNLRSDRRIEKTIDYFAQDRRGGVHYLGEDVDEYPAGGGVSHEGQWRAGRRGARPGLLMPAEPAVGRRFKSENAPPVAVEKDKVVAMNGTETVRGVRYRRVMTIREHATVPKPAEFETKTYAPGVGVITEANGGVGLVGCT